MRMTRSLVAALAFTVLALALGWSSRPEAQINSRAFPVRANALSNGAVTINGSGGILDTLLCVNNAATPAYVQLFNTATSVTLGTTTPTLSFGMAVSGIVDLSGSAIWFSSVIKAACTTTATGSTAPSPTCDCNFGIR